ncbi:Gfo/Idh/MocA family protein [Haladaptatus sp. GCM10025707]|uniref:Gfo/Idh/MocA family protein n=1 Tax=unclassified Haladaptatus TaxID=2622732 RepID=UPI0023E7CD91|nr:MULTISPECIES: Gfo/Idh/MocA family oxidoreductase [unclassified Haladaptatus]
MTAVTVAFIGTGPNPENPQWGTSAAMAYRHARAYDHLDQCTLVACADLVRDHAEAFAEEFGFDAVYEDYGEMLRKVQPDIVSVCTPVPTHAPIVTDVAASGHVRAIHCEKPMASVWKDCEEMAAVCDEHDVQLSFNHQRRYAEETETTKRLLDDGELGDIERFEIGGLNLFDFGSHLIDLCNYFNGERPAEWALCQIDYTEENVRYGTHNENRALASWAYENGVNALLASGSDADLVDCLVRVCCTGGTVELWPDDGEATMRVRRTGEEAFEEYECDERQMILGAIEDVVTSLQDGTEPLVSAANVLNANEIIFGCWESVRQHGRVEFPIDIDDNPLESMVEDGTFTPAPKK